MCHFGQFLPKFGEKWIFLEKVLCQFLSIPIIYHGAKNQKKINNPFLSLMLNCWWTDRQTDRQTGRQTDRQTDRPTDRKQWFYRTLVRTGVQKIKSGTECNSHWGGKNNRKLNPFIKTMVHRSNIHYSKINKKRNRKKYVQFPQELQKNETS